MLCCRDLIHGPFAVINADDYYGKESFRNIYAFLEKYSPDKPNDFCMAGFILKNTLSENGTVTRGLCAVNQEGYLENVMEMPGILKTYNGASIVTEEGQKPIDPETHVSMNMWGLTPEFMNTLDREFRQFFREGGDLSKREYLLPILIGQLLQRGEISVKVLETHDTWFGITYKDDLQAVRDAFKRLNREGVYHTPLFGDLL